MILFCCASELGLPEDLSAIEVILYYYYYYTYTQSAHLVVFRTIVVGYRDVVVADMSLLVITVWIGFLVRHERRDVKDYCNRNKNVCVNKTACLCWESHHPVSKP